MGINYLYNIDDKILNYQGSIPQSLYVRKTVSGKDTIYTIHPIRAQSKLAIWLQEHSRFFNFIITYFISKSLLRDVNCHKLNSNMNYENALDKITAGITSDSSGFFKNCNTITNVYRSIYPAIIDNPNVSDDKKNEWIMESVESVRKQGSFRTYHDILLDVANQKSYGIQELIDLFAKNYKNMTTTTKEKYIDYIFSVSDDLDESLKRISVKINFNKERDDFFVRVAEHYCKDGELEKALKTTYKVNDLQKQFILIAMIAEEYYDRHDYEKALQTINRIHSSDPKIKEAFIERIAMLYFYGGDLEKALSTIKQIVYDKKTKNAFIAKMAESYYKTGDIAKWLAFISKNIHDIKTREALIAKAAEEYFKAGDFKKTIEIIQNILSDIQTKDYFFVKVTNVYLIEGDIENALQTIKMVKNATKSKDCAYEAIARLYMNRGQWESALFVISQINDFFTKERVRADFTARYYAKKRAESKPDPKPEVKAPPTPYQILGITNAAKQGDIKKAYAKLALQYHPDKVGQKREDESEEDFVKRKEANTEKFRQIQEAYETIIRKAKANLE